MPEGGRSIPNMSKQTVKVSPIAASTPVRSSNLHKAGVPKLYDPGLATTLAYKSSITFLNGSAGILRYRGYPIEDLATSTTFDEVAYLLLFKYLPTRHQLEDFCASLSNNATIPSHIISIVKAFPTSAHPMTILVTALASLTAAYPDLNPAINGQSVYSSTKARIKVIHIVMGIMPSLAALILHHTSGTTYQNNFRKQQKPLSYTERFFQQAFTTQLRGMTSKTRSVLIHALDTLLVLHADHEQNCSTSAVRHLSSSGVDVFSSLSSGTAALYGPLHGGACEAVIHMLTRIGHSKNVPEFLEKVKNRQELLMGFGHRVYKTYDPRAKIVRRLLKQVLESDSNSTQDPLIEVATSLEKAALNDTYFVERKLYPNIDFYSGIIYKTLRVDPSFFGMFFAIGRCAGWLAHWQEFLDDNDRRIARPHQWFTGEVGPLKVPNIGEREQKQKSENADDWYSAKL